MEIQGATLTIYLENGEDVNLDLNPVQLSIIKETLGLKIDLQTGLANMYGNNTLKLIYNNQKSFLDDLKRQVN